MDWIHTAIYFFSLFHVFCLIGDQLIPNYLLISCWQNKQRVHFLPGARKRFLLVGRAPPLPFFSLTSASSLLSLPSFPFFLPFPSPSLSSRSLPPFLHSHSLLFPFPISSSLLSPSASFTLGLGPRNPARESGSDVGSSSWVWGRAPAEI